MRRIMLDEFQKNVLADYERRISEAQLRLQFLQNEMNWFAMKCITEAGGDSSQTTWEPVRENERIVAFKRVKPKQQ